ncbi:hypothetical protein EDB83DRAFT_1536664 [Lactarius deliciosus]|nr:hypothetical protein EDB83DRAFT_1536664 [Lactarius deliciosus]
MTCGGGKSTLSVVRGLLTTVSVLSFTLGGKITLTPRRISDGGSDFIFILFYQCDGLWAVKRMVDQELDQESSARLFIILRVMMLLYSLLLQ